MNDKRDLHLLYLAITKEYFLLEEGTVVTNRITGRRFRFNGITKKGNDSWTLIK